MPKKTFFCEHNFKRLENTLEQIIQGLYADGFQNLNSP